MTSNRSVVRRIGEAVIITEYQKVSNTNSNWTKDGALSNWTRDGASKYTKIQIINTLHLEHTMSRAVFNVSMIRRLKSNIYELRSSWITRFCLTRGTVMTLIVIMTNTVRLRWIAYYRSELSLWVMDINFGGHNDDWRSLTVLDIFEGPLGGNPDEQDVFTIFFDKR